jgi:hypothetical protein
LSKVTPKQLEVKNTIPLNLYLSNDLPAASSHIGKIIYILDESVPAFSDGTNWRRVTDRTIVP